MFMETNALSRSNYPIGLNDLKHFINVPLPLQEKKIVNFFCNDCGASGNLPWEAGGVPHP